MGWFDSPTIAIRKQLPDGFRAKCDVVENFAMRILNSEPKHVFRYQIGIVLALWVKAAEMQGEVILAPGPSKRVQDVYASCVRTVRGGSYQAFRVLEQLSEQGGTFGVPPVFYRQLGINVIGVT